MKLRYYSEFRSINETLYRLEIHTDTTKKAEELTLTDSPFVVEYESGELYKPLKMSNAVASIITSKVLTDLYTGKNHGVEVYLYNVTDNILEWFGYLTPNLYSSDFVSDVDTLALEAIDTISSLENTKYSYIDDSTDLKTFKRIICYILDKADPAQNISKVYIQKTNRLTQSSTSCILDEVYSHERNFFDEADEPNDCRTVLEEITKYLGLTLIQYRNAYYFIDYSFIKNNYKDFFYYDRKTKTTQSASIDLPILNLSNIGIAENSATISIGDIYNKVSIVSNMNHIKSLIPEIFDEDDLKNQNEDPDKIYETKKTIDKKEYMILSQFLQSDNNWETTWSSMLIPSEKDFEITNETINKVQFGCFFQRVDDYLVEDGEPSSLSWKDYLTFANTPSAIQDKTPIVLKKNSTSIFKGGYFIIDLEYKYSEFPFPSNALKSTVTKYKNDKYTAYLYDTKFRCHLRIGEYYYTGDEWKPYSEYLSNISFYNQVTGARSIYGKTEYYIRNADGSETVIDEETYNKIDLKDCFFLVHKNKVGDTIFDTAKRLTNSVSYKYNLSDSEDGVLIPLPNFVINGELHFTVYSPDRLGGTENYVTGGEDGGSNVPYCHVSDLKLIYTNVKYRDETGEQSNDDDVVYTNIINDENITEMNDLELFVNSYARNIASYSNAATKKGNNYDYVETFYNPIAGIDALPERILLDRLYQHYSTPKFIYKNCLNRGFSILSQIKEPTLNKIMVIDCMDIDYAKENCFATLKEV